MFNCFCSACDKFVNSKNGSFPTHVFLRNRIEEDKIKNMTQMFTLCGSLTVNYNDDDSIVVC